MEEIIKQLPPTIIVKVDEDHECNGTFELELQDYSIEFYLEASAYFSKYVPSQGPEHAPEYPELEGSSETVSDVKVWDSNGEEINVDTELLIKEIKERIDYEF